MPLCNLGVREYDRLHENAYLRREVSDPCTVLWRRIRKGENRNQGEACMKFSMNNFLDINDYRIPTSDLFEHIEFAFNCNFPQGTDHGHVGSSNTGVKI